MSKNGILMILSPAKSLDVSPLTSPMCTSPDCDTIKTKEVIQAIKTRKEGELATLLGISTNLAKRAHEVRCWTWLPNSCSHKWGKGRVSLIYTLSSILAIVLEHDGYETLSGRY